MQSVHTTVIASTFQTGSDNKNRNKTYSRIHRLDQRDFLRARRSNATIWVPDKLNADYDPATPKMTNSRQEKNSRLQETQPDIRKIICQMCCCTGYETKYCRKKQTNASPQRQFDTMQPQEGTLKQQRDFEGISRRAPEVNQLPEFSGYGGQPEYNYEYDSQRCLC